MPTGAHELKNIITFVSTKSWLNTPHFKCAVGPHLLRTEEERQYEWGMPGCRYKTQVLWSSAHKTVPLILLGSSLPTGTAPVSQNSSLEKYKSNFDYSIEEGRRNTPLIMIINKHPSAVSAITNPLYILQVISLGIFMSHDRPAKITL